MYATPITTKTSMVKMESITEWYKIFCQVNPVVRLMYCVPQTKIFTNRHLRSIFIITMSYLILNYTFWAVFNKIVVLALEISRNLFQKYPNFVRKIPLREQISIFQMMPKFYDDWNKDVWVMRGLLKTNKKHVIHQAKKMRWVPAEHQNEISQQDCTVMIVLFIWC